MDGAIAVRELEFDDRPCRECGGKVVAAPSNTCQSCDAWHVTWGQPGPQTEFLEHPADIVLIGGAAGGGKTHILLVDWLIHAHRYPGTLGVLCRHVGTDITSGLWDQATKLFEPTGAHVRAGHIMDMAWPNGSKLLFRSLKDRSVERFKGPEFSWVGVEEANECTIGSITYLLTRMRTDGPPAYMRLTCNPDPDHPLAQWVAPYLTPEGTADRSKSGMIRWTMRSATTDKRVFGATPEEVGELAGVDAGRAMSFAFIPALLEDNRAVNADDYRRKFAQVTLVRRAQLELGNWLIKSVTGGMLPRELWGGAATPLREPLAPIIHWVRAWDTAVTVPKPGSDPDYTIGVLVGWDIHGRGYLAGMVACRQETPRRDALMASTAQGDGPGVTQVIEVEGGSQAVSWGEHMQRRLRASGKCGDVVTVRAIKNKIDKVQPIASELLLGMDGNTPRVIEMQADDDGIWSPRWYWLDQSGWMAEPYEDAGDHPPTLGALARKHVYDFPNPAEHDDGADALGIAHQARPQPPVVQDTLLDRMRRTMRG